MENEIAVIDTIFNIEDEEIRKNILLQLTRIIEEDYIEGVKSGAITEKENNPANHAYDLIECVRLTLKDFKQTFYFDFLDDNLQKYFE